MTCEFSFIYKIAFYANVFIMLLLVSQSHAWDQEEMELFDVVEEVNQNFYELMKISKDATPLEVRKAYRTLSKQLHPDKNKAPDAEVKFRQLAAVYEILRDQGKRERYDRVLVDGLPDWRSPIYYYRRARKLSLLECSIIITIVISITQYLMAWGSYLDKKHTMEEYLCKKYKIKYRGRKKAEDYENALLVEKELEKIPRPKCWDIFPIQFCSFIIFIISNGPTMIKSTIFAIKEERIRREEEKRQEEEEIKRIKEEEERKKERKAQSKQRKKVSNLPDYTGRSDTTSYSKNLTHESKPIRAVSQNEPVIVGGPWTDEDFMELARLMAKYPGGTVDRWETIASHMNRTVFEVTKMSGRVISELSARSSNASDSKEEEVKVKLKTKGGKHNTEEHESPEMNCGADEFWSVIQQRNLEKALKIFPKGTDQRWDRIARCVPDKSKEDCILRFKYLAERIKKKREEMEEKGTHSSISEIAIEDQNLKEDSIEDQNLKNDCFKDIKESDNDVIS